MATYYVDTASNAAGDGTTADLTGAHCAWDDIADVNAHTFSPGDFILFKCGCTWNERLAPPSSGTDGHQITFGAYGAGDRPIIDGTGLANAMAVSSKSFINIDGLHLTGSTGQGNCVLGLWGSNDLVVTDCEIDSGDGFGISCTGEAAATYNVHIAYCAVHDNTGNSEGGCAGLYVGHTTTGGPDNILVEHCTVYNNGDTAIYDHGIYFAYVTNGTAQYNTTYSNFANGLAARDCGGPIIFRYNHSYSNGYHGLGLGGTQAAGVGSQIIYNVIHDNSYLGIWVNGACDGYLIANNTIVNNSDASSHGSIELHTGAQDHVIKNNIFYQDYAVAPTRPIRVATTTEITANTWDYNLVYYKNGDGKVAYVTAPTASKTWAEWQSAGADANGVNADPGLIDEDNHNFLLSSTSLCINAGVDVGLTTDYDGYIVLDDPDIGAHEYQGIILIVADALHGHTSDGIELSQSQLTLTVADCLHSHTADNVGVWQNSLEVQDSQHTHAADGLLVLIQCHHLTVADGLHAHLADSLTISQTTIKPVITGLSKTDVFVGDVITITGTGFGNAKGAQGAVRFKGVSAAITSWSETSIVVTVPKITNRGTVIVYVTNLIYSNGFPYNLSKRGKAASR